MTLPDPKADAHLEVQFDGTNWVEVTQDVLTPIAVTNHGRQNYMDDPQPGELSVVLDDGDGDYNPSNPTGAHFPNVTLGVPARLRLGDPQAGLRLRRWDNSTAEMWAQTVDHSSLDITGDIDIRIDLQPESWRPAGLTTLAAKYEETGDQRSWLIRLSSTGTIRLAWSSTGTSASEFGFSPAIPDDGARRAIRVTLDVDNGAGQRTFALYEAGSVDGPWTQLQQISLSGTTSIFASTAPVTIGTGPDGGPAVGVSLLGLAGTVYRFQLRNGIDGTVVADADFAAQPAGSEPFTDTIGREWTMHRGARITDSATRFVGRATKWEPTWPVGDVSDTNEPGEARVKVDAAGLLASINNNDYPLHDTVAGFVDSNVDQCIDYWPLTDPFGSVRARSGIGRESLLPVGDLFDAAEFGRGDLAPWLPSSAQTSGSVGRMRATGLRSTATGGWVVDFMYRTPAPGTWGEDWPQQLDVVVRDDGNGTDGVAWRANFIPTNEPLDFGDTENVIELLVVVAGSPPVASSVPFPDSLRDGQPHHIRLRAFEQSGSAAALFVDVDGVNVDSVVNSNIGTTAIQPPTQISFEWTTLISAIGNEVARLPIVFGQATLWQEPVPGLTDSVFAYFGHEGEPAGTRLERLAAEEGVPLTVLGDPALSAGMGPQRELTLLELLLECERTDGGLLAEAHDAAELLYRPLRTLYNQPATVFDAGNGHGEIINPFAPVLDFSDVVNDLTVRAATTGASVRGTVDSGPKSTRPPPAGSGPKRREHEVNAFADGTLGDHLGWRLHLGTAPGMRYPAVAPAVSVVEGLLDRWHRAQIGDRLQVDGLPSQHAPEPVDLLLLGWTQTIRTDRVQAEANTTREEPYHIAEVAHPEYGIIGHGLALVATPIDETATTLTIQFEGGATWVHEVDYDIIVGGERMTVTAVAAPLSATQQLTVVRSVNGVVKAHNFPERVDLFHKSYIGL